METMTTQKPNQAQERNALSAEHAELMKMHLDAEKKISNNIMSIRLSSDGLIYKDSQSAHSNTTILEPVNYHYGKERLSGVYIHGVQYFDLSSVKYLNNSGMATLIDLLKSVLTMGVEVQFVNVDENIKRKIREAGLEKIINCSGT